MSVCVYVCMYVCMYVCIDCTYVRKHVGSTCFRVVVSTPIVCLHVQHGSSSPYGGFKVVYRNHLRIER